METSINKVTIFLFLANFFIALVMISFLFQKSDSKNAKDGKMVLCGIPRKGR